MFKTYDFPLLLQLYFKHAHYLYVYDPYMFIFIKKNHMLTLFENLRNSMGQRIFLSFFVIQFKNEIISLHVECNLGMRSRPAMFFTTIFYAWGSVMNGWMIKVVRVRVDG